jgi:hypothetical protein
MKVGEYTYTKRRLLFKLYFDNEAFGYADYKIIDDTLVLQQFLVCNKRTNFSFRRLIYDDVWFNGYRPIGEWRYCYYVGVPK